MKAIVLVAGVNHEVWFRDTRDERQVQTLCCLDRDAFNGVKMKQTFDYTPSPEESRELDLDRLDGSIITIAIGEVRPGNGGRLSVRGIIDRGSVPKEAVRNGEVKAPGATGRKG